MTAITEGLFVVALTIYIGKHLLIMFVAGLPES